MPTINSESCMWRRDGSLAHLLKLDIKHDFDEFCRRGVVGREGLLGIIMLYVTIALMAITLVVVVWQSTRIQRIKDLLELVRDSQCEQEQRSCENACARERDAVINANQIARSFCELARIRAYTDCLIKHPGNSAAQEECRREADRRFDDCVAPLVAEEDQANRAYEACVRGCADKLVECQRKSLQDAVLGRDDKLPTRDDLVQPSNPPINPPSPRG